MEIKLPDTIATPHDLANIIIELESYLQWQENGTVAKQAKTKNTLPVPELSVAAKELIRQANELKQSPEHLYATLSKFRNAAPTISITLAGPAPAPLRHAITAWVRRNLNPQLLIIFSFNHTILGGMVVRYQSRLYDWSYRRSLRNKQALLGEILNRV